MENKNIITHIKENWILYSFVFQLVATFVLNNADHKEFRSDIAELKDNSQETQITLAEINSRLASIDTNLEYLKRAR